jgi:dynein intermediate chain 2
VWDYFYKQNDPTLQVQVTDQVLTSMRVQDGGKMVAVGARDGSVTLLDICDGLSMMQTGEKHAISAIFERETKREKNLEARQKELRLKAKKAGGGAAEIELDNNPETVAIIEREFFDLINKKKDVEETNPLEVELNA